MYDKNKKKYFKKKNIYYRPWGNYTNLFKGNNFLIKELYVKPKGILSLQKHNYRSEHWLITKGTPIITINKKKFLKKPEDHVYIPEKTKHRIQNLGKKPVKILEAQIGSLLKESDIIRYVDAYGRV
jgi:mannose-1-phosphate guanylyltransferase/mannose-6-phosphate isomerase